MDFCVVGDGRGSERRHAAIVYDGARHSGRRLANNEKHGYCEIAIWSHVMSQAIDRREALGRVALLLGGALSAPALMGALRETTGRAWAAAPPGAPRTLNPAQLECVATAADHIVPETDTPGARAAGVHHFIDTLLTDHYPATERDRFVAGLTRLDERARSAKGSAFAECAPDQRVAWLTELDTRAYGPDAG